MKEECCEKFEEALAEGIIHDWSFYGRPRYVVSSEDDITMDITHCPFCGKKIVEVKHEA